MCSSAVVITDRVDDRSSPKKSPRNILLRRRLQKMSSRQEFANAWTMAVPSLYYAYVVYSRRGDLPLHAWILIVSVWVHLPFSSFYHVQCALKDDIDTLGCLSRRLDHAFIHFSSACVGYGTTQGSVAYFAVCAVFNVIAAALHACPHVDVTRNQRFTLSAIALYVAPLAYRNDLKNLLGGLLFFIPAGLCFKTYFLGGYSHAMFHVLMGIFAGYMLDSALLGY